MTKLTDIKSGWIIHIFALLHAVTSLTCRAAGVNDELLLTVLTMTMILIICMKRWHSIEIAAACVIVANIIGYALGNFGAELLVPIIGSTPIVNALSTIATTEILGWTVEFVNRRFSQGKDSDTDISLYSPQMQWLILAVAIIFILRIGFVFLLSSYPFSGPDILDTSRRVFSNSAALMILIAVNLLYIRWHDDHLRKNVSEIAKAGRLAGFVAIASLLETMIIGAGFPFRLTAGFWDEFPILFVTSLLTEITIYCIVFMINYSINAGRQVREAKGLANVAQYRYLNLKQQVNPHFLFNSLNILDCLVCEEKTEQASIYIHKLAGLYRYMLKTEDETLVTLQEELDFTNKYLDLLKVRFQDSLIVETDIPDECLGRSVLPCSLQLLVENATKHNAVSHDRPLVIKIKAEAESIQVSNEIIPKISKSPSNGLGLKYMKQQYLDLSGKSVDIMQSDETFCVTIPLL